MLIFVFWNENRTPLPYERLLSHIRYNENDVNDQQT